MPAVCYRPAFLSMVWFLKPIGKRVELKMSKFLRSNKAFLLSGLLVMLLLAACSRKIAFSASTIVPGAEGAVKVKRDNNGNNAIEVKVLHLADPQKLPLPQNTYVVWMESSEGLKNLGQLKTGSGLLSSTRKGELETVTPFKPTRIFITGEVDGNIQYPGNQVVLSTTSFN